MSYNENLVNRVRESLVNLQKKVEEKRMFQGLTFMVDDKMCIGIRENEIMCRIDPKVYESALEKNRLPTYDTRKTNYKRLRFCK